MAQKTNKKRMIMLSVLLIVVVAGGGFWTYQISKPIETTQPIDPKAVNTTNTNPTEDSLVGLSINTVYSIKEEAIANIEDFLSTSGSPDTIWNDFYTNRQFNRLNDLDLEIDIENYKNNPNPFVIPSSTKAELEE